MFYLARQISDECPVCYDHLAQSLQAQGRTLLPMVFTIGRPREPREPPRAHVHDREAPVRTDRDAHGVECKTGRCRSRPSAVATSVLMGGAAELLAYGTAVVLEDE